MLNKALFSYRSGSSNEELLLSRIVQLHLGTGQIAFDA